MVSLAGSKYHDKGCQLSLISSLAQVIAIKFDVSRAECHAIYTGHVWGIYARSQVDILFKHIHYCRLVHHLKDALLVLLHKDAES